MRPVHSDPIIQHVANRVRAYRLEQNISRYELALAAGMNRNYLGYIECAQINIGLRSLDKLAYAMNMTPAELLDGFETDGDA